MIYSEQHGIQMDSGTVMDRGAVVLADPCAYANELEREAVEGVCTNCGADCRDKSWPKHRRGELIRVLCQSCHDAE